jgi:hypothetical protein
MAAVQTLEEDDRRAMGARGREHAARRFGASRLVSDIGAIYAAHLRDAVAGMGSVQWEVGNMVGNRAGAGMGNRQSR